MLRSTAAVGGSESAAKRVRHSMNGDVDANSEAFEVTLFCTAFESSVVAHPSFLVVRRNDWHEDNAVLDAFKKHSALHNVVMLSCEISSQPPANL